MPDICMCTNENCPKKETCYRYKATPSLLQSYTSFDEVDCKYYWPMEERKTTE